MIEIKGEKTTAICYANVIEEEAIEQIRRMCDQDFTEGCRVRIMPDVHAGKGCTVGTTMTVDKKVPPNIVGVDIGCGMYTVNLGRQEIDLEKFDKACHGIPSGKNVWQEKKEDFDLTKLRCCYSLKQTGWLERSLGTLGGGNHFIEIDRKGRDELSGDSYGEQKSGENKWQRFIESSALELHQGKKKYMKKKNALIAEYKAEGRRKEINRRFWNYAGERNHYPFRKTCVMSTGTILKSICTT